MGCDIHSLIERKVGDKWVTEIICNYESHAIEQRQYGVFAALASDCGRCHEDWTGNNPSHGFPKDASDTARMLFEDQKGDAHTPSYLPLNIAWEAYLKGCSRYAGSKVKEQWQVFGLEDYELAEHAHRLVFWFDN